MNGYGILILSFHLNIININLVSYRKLTKSRLTNLILFLKIIVIYDIVLRCIYLLIRDLWTN